MTAPRIPAEIAATIGEAKTMTPYQLDQLGRSLEHRPFDAELLDRVRAIVVADPAYVATHELMLERIKAILTLRFGDHATWPSSRSQGATWPHRVALGIEAAAHAREYGDLMAGGDRNELLRPWRDATTPPASLATRWIAQGDAYPKS